MKKEMVNEVIGNIIREEPLLEDVREGLTNTLNRIASNLVFGSDLREEVKTSGVLSGRLFTTFKEARNYLSKNDYSDMRSSKEAEQLHFAQKNHSEYGKNEMDLAYSLDTERLKKAWNRVDLSILDPKDDNDPFTKDTVKFNGDMVV